MENTISETDESKPFDFESNFIVCKCETKKLYDKHLGDGGYDWCKNCDRPLGDNA